jgi:hypothetical protein
MLGVIASRAFAAKQHLHLRATARSAVQVSQLIVCRDCFVGLNLLAMTCGDDHASSL